MHKKADHDDEKVQWGHIKQKLINVLRGIHLSVILVVSQWCTPQRPTPDSIFLMDISFPNFRYLFLIQEQLIQIICIHLVECKLQLQPKQLLPKVKLIHTVHLIAYSWHSAQVSPTRAQRHILCCIPRLSWSYIRLESWNLLHNKGQLLHAHCCHSHDYSLESESIQPHLPQTATWLQTRTRTGRWIHQQTNPIILSLSSNSFLRNLWISYQ